jgi:hypothetical protein
MSTPRLPAVRGALSGRNAARMDEQLAKTNRVTHLASKTGALVEAPVSGNPLGNNRGKPARFKRVKELDKW